jgi:hypothetical protein
MVVPDTSITGWEEGSQAFYGKGAVKANKLPWTAFTKGIENRRLSASWSSLSPLNSSPIEGEELWREAIPEEKSGFLPLTPVKVLDIVLRL